MYARVARFDHGDQQTARDAAQRMRQEVEAHPAPPEGVPACGFMLLLSRGGASTLAVALFNTEDDLRRGHEALNGMSPPPEASGTRVDVEMFEVAVDVRVPAGAGQPR